jgi:hypothetical protein
VLVRIQSRLESDGPWSAIDGWSSAELEVLPRVGEFISLQHIARHGVWLRVEHIVHTPNNVRPISESDERPYKAILFVTWMAEDAVIAPNRDCSTKLTLPAARRNARSPGAKRLRSRWRQ